MTNKQLDNIAKSFLNEVNNMLENDSNIKVNFVNELVEMFNKEYGT